MEERQGSARETNADSLMAVAYEVRDYQQLLTLADSLHESRSLSDMKYYYWRGYACSRLRMMRSAEMAWQEAVKREIYTDEDLEFYGKSANRLAGLLYLKTDYESTIRVAVPAVELMKERGYDMNTDYVNLQIFIGSCQLKLGKPREAASCYALAYQLFLQQIEADSDIASYTSSIIGIITITESYLHSGYYQEAYEWTGRFDGLLLRYRQHPQANDNFIDKQWARLHFYRASALEGLGNKADAQKAYKEALNTRYAKTGDGQIEAAAYLSSAHRWGEAADKMKMLDAQMSRYDMKMTLDNIQAYYLPKFRANVGAGRSDSALAVSSAICNALDSAIVWQKQDASAELSAIYDTQQKENEIAEQRAKMSRQRLLSAIVALLLVIVFFMLFIYFRHQSSKRLEHAYKQLEVANARAEESSRMKTNFIQQISHEIRTPLNILSGFTQIVTTPGLTLDEETSKDVNQKIMENTNRITRLVNKMLELSDANSRAVIERTDTVPALQVVAQAAEDSGASAASHVRFDIQYSEDVEAVELTTNLQQATRALTLILGNALKFTRQGSVILIVGLQDEMVSFVIEDTGIGVPQSEAEHIFDEFVQLDDYYEGTGIGLTVARSIARRLGGDVVLDTAYTGGARFVMTLPLSAGADR